MAGATQGPGPTVIKHYALDRELGRGAMGSVWAGEDRRDGSKVAVKLLHPHLGVDPEFRARFEREAHVAALLRSPYTVHLLDYGVSGESCFIVMEFVDGHAVSQELAGGPMDPARAFRIATEVARALEEAGARGVVHRDIKPDNVLIDQDDRAKVTDFGIARQSASAAMTSAGIFVGTPAYAAPEQATGDVDHRADIYALGAMLFAMLTGHPPFRGSSVIEILEAHKSAQIPMNELAHLPDSVVNVVRRCLEKDPRDRYQSATELVGALERAAMNYAQFVRGQGGAPAPGAGTARPTPSTVPLPPPTRPRPAAPPATPTGAPTRIESPPSQAAPAPGRAPAAPVTPAAGGPVRMEFTEKSKPGRDGTARYSLALVNTANSVVRLRLVPTDPSGVLQVNMPGRAAVPPGTTILLDVAVTPRALRTRGPDRRLGFGVTAVDEATGATAGTASGEYVDVVGGAAGGSGRALVIAGVAAAVIIAGGLAAFLVFGSGGGDGEDGNGATVTATATADTRPGVAPGRYDYNLQVTENGCPFGLSPGAMYALSFEFEPVSGDALRDGEQVRITGITETGDRVDLGRAQFTAAAFEFTYPVEAQDQRGTATLATAFGDDSAIDSATLTEVYDTGDTECTIVAAQ
jgi:serine/threonine-protein kinase